MVHWRRYDRFSLPRGLVCAGNCSVGEFPPFCLDSLRNRLRDSAKLVTLRKRVAHVAENREGQKNGGLFHHRRYSVPLHDTLLPRLVYAITSSVEEPGAKLVRSPTSGGPSCAERAGRARSYSRHPWHCSGFNTGTHPIRCHPTSAFKACLRAVVKKLLVMRRGHTRLDRWLWRVAQTCEIRSEFHHHPGECRAWACRLDQNGDLTYGEGLGAGRIIDDTISPSKR
jgi:hypothetical protein